jgi:outer membrane protein
MKTSLRILLSGLVCVCAALSITPLAVSANEIKVGIISIQEIIDTAKVGQEARNILEAKKNELEPKFQGEQESLQAQAKEIETKGTVWSEEVRAEKERDYQKNLREYQLKVEDAQYEMKQLEKKVLDPIFKELQAVITEVGKKEGLTLVFEKSRSNGLLYADESLDISEVVRKTLDEKMAK